MDPSYKALFNLDLAKLPNRNLLPRFNISNNMTTNPEDPPPKDLTTVKYGNKDKIKYIELSICLLNIFKYKNGNKKQ